ncbi:hypothetical protein [Pseudomonas aeruginosa]|uniref:hypothetical protein n=1 Tax=Pseudomonas aeruginosa TaxID=287 RepID=UPI0031B6B6B4
MTTAQAAVETVETTNTAAAVETPETTTSAAQPEVNDLTFLVQKGKEGTIAEYAKCAEKKLIDAELVSMVRSVYRDISADIAPMNVDAEIAELNKQLLAEQSTEKRLSILLNIQDLLTQQKNEGSDIRTRLTGVPFEQIAVAYAEEFKQMLEAVLVDKLAYYHKATLKIKGTRSASTGPKEKKKAGPSVVIEYKGEKIEIAKGKGPLPKKLAEVIAAFAKETKVEKVDKSTFITALEANKVKGVKFIESKAGEV